MAPKSIKLPQTGKRKRRRRRIFDGHKQLSAAGNRCGSNRTIGKKKIEPCRTIKSDPPTEGNRFAVGGKDSRFANGRPRRQNREITGNAPLARTAERSRSGNRFVVVQLRPNLNTIAAVFNKEPSSKCIYCRQRIGNGQHRLRRLRKIELKQRRQPTAFDTAGGSFCDIPPPQFNIRIRKKTRKKQFVACNSRRRFRT